MCVRNRQWGSAAWSSIPTLEPSLSNKQNDTCLWLFPKRWSASWRMFGIDSDISSVCLAVWLLRCWHTFVYSSWSWQAVQKMVHILLLRYKVLPLSINLHCRDLQYSISSPPLNFQAVRYPGFHRSVGKTLIVKLELRWQRYLFWGDSLNLAF